MIFGADGVKRFVVGIKKYVWARVSQLLVLAKRSTGSSFFVDTYCYNSGLLAHSHTPLLLSAYLSTTFRLHFLRLSTTTHTTCYANVARYICGRHFGGAHSRLIATLHVIKM